jgi:hypothetical protein
MSINPVQGIGPADEVRFENANPRPSPTVPAAQGAKSAQPSSGNPPKQEVPTSQSVPPSGEMPQDEVEVQRDSAANDEIVIKYMDHSGNVILQVPSSQVLGVTRAIDQDFQREQRLRANTSAVVRSNEGEKAHGH